MSSLAEEDYPNAYWGENLDRLVKMKEQFDPDNYLHQPHSVPSAKQ
jgi:FAD/FMN-containing dehydrogenase